MDFNYLLDDGSYARSEAHVFDESSSLRNIVNIFFCKLENLFCNRFKFPDFHSPSITQTDFDAKPMVLLMGQYSTGKTSFIRFPGFCIIISITMLLRFLLERDFPGANIGPEPTTDRFTGITL